MDYRISVEEKGEVRRDIHIEIPRAVYNQRFDSALSKAAAHAKVKGFRPGRVPKAMVAKLYGSEIHEDVVSRIVSDALHHTAHEHKLKIIGSPEFTVNDEDKEQDIKVTAGVSLLPTPTIAKAVGVEIEVEVDEVTEEDVKEQIDAMRERLGTFEPLEGRTVSETGDFVEIDFDATVNGEAFPGSKRDGAVLELGAKRLPEALEAGLVGMEVGETKSVEVSFPEDLRDETLAGKTAIYQVSLRGLKRRVLPEVDDAFAKQTGMGENVEEFHDSLQSFLKNDLETKNSRAKEQALFEKLIALNPFEIPELLVDDEIRSILFEMNVLNPRDERSHQMDVSRFREHLGKQAEYRVRSGIIIDTLVKQENFTVTEEELENWLAEMAKDGYPSREAFNKEMGYPKNKDRLRHLLARERMTKQLIEKATIQEKKKDRSKAEASLDE